MARKQGTKTSKRKIKKIIQKKNYLFQVSLTMFIAASIFAGLALVKRNQNIKEKAAVVGGTATVWIDPTEGSYKTGDTITSSIYFSTASTPISGIAVRLIYLYSGNTSDYTIKDIKLNSSLIDSGDWVCPTQTSFLMGGNLIVDIACANISSAGYIGNNDLLGTISLNVNSSPSSTSSNTLSVYFDAALSVITRKSDNQDILALPTTSAIYSIGNFLSPTPTGKRDCSISLYPASLFLPVGQSTILKANVIGKKVTSVKFSSSQPNIVSVSPLSDSRPPYETTIKSLAYTGEGPVIITATAYLGSNKLCQGFSVVKIGAPTSLTPTYPIKPTITVH